MSKDDLQKVRDAIEKSFSLGQTYWQQADSDSYHENAKSNITLGKYHFVRDEAFTIIDRLMAESDSKPSSVLDVVGYLDDYGNFESYMQPWMADEPNVNWRPVYLHPPITKPENESVVKEFCGTDSGPDGDCTVHGFQDEHGVLHVTNVDCSDGKKA